MHKLFWASVGMLLIAACSKNNATTEAVAVSLAGDTIVVNEGSPILEQLITQKSTFHNFSEAFSAVGAVRPVSGKIAEIAPPFEGRVVKSYVRLGQRVERGSPIFDFSSSEFYEATKAYFVSRSANELAQRRYNRQQELAKNGVAAQKDLEQAQNEALVAEQELEQAKSTLKIFQIDAASLTMGQPLKVVSPISGEVVKSNITIGSYVKEDAEPLAVVADLSIVWVAAMVKEDYFGAIRQGNPVEVFTHVNPKKAIRGTVYYVGEMLEEETRSLEVIIECSNTDRVMKPGMFCTVHFSGAPEKAILLPSTAIMKEEDHDFVLIEKTKGTYIRRKVESETVSSDSVRVINGLKEGENVVVRGGIYLNM